MEITYARALKIWWSFAWRMMVIFMGASLIVSPVMMWLMTPPTDPNAFDPTKIAYSESMLGLFSLLTMIGFAAIQVFAMRWALRAKWSDFKIIATAVDRPN